MAAPPPPPMPRGCQWPLGESARSPSAASRSWDEARIARRTPELPGRAAPAEVRLENCATACPGWLVTSARLLSPATSSMLPRMFAVSEEEAAAIRAVYEQRGELSAAVELRRRFPGILDNVQARECARIIAG